MISTLRYRLPIRAIVRTAIGTLALLALSTTAVAQSGAGKGKAKTAAKEADTDAAVAAKAPVGPRMIITEIMYNPNSKEDRGQTEWVEIANVGDEAIDIKDWRLDDEDKFDWGKFSCTLAPGGVVVLCNADYVTAEEFRAAWLPADNAGGDGGSADAAACQVIAVKWGGIANSPGPDNEILQLLDDKGEVVCEIKQEGQWPDCGRPDGASIYLIDLAAENLSSGRLWKRSDKGVAGARNNIKGEIFGGTDTGSPGSVPGLSPAPTAPGDGPVAAKPPAKNSGKRTPPAATQPTTKPANTIDY